MTRPPTVLGPLFWEERNRLGRRASYFLLRAVFALALFAAVAAAYPAAGERLNPAKMAEYGHRMFWGVVVVQFVAVWLVTPFFAVAVLTEEREKNTLDLLLTTTLSGREIVAGKLFARLAVVGGVVLAGLPVLAVLQWFGGYTLETLAVVYLCLFANLWGVGGVAAGVAALSGSYRQAFYTAWPVLGIGTAFPCFGPWAALFQMADYGTVNLWLLAAMLGMNVLLGFLGLFVAVGSVRPWETKKVERIRPVRRNFEDERPRKIVRRVPTEATEQRAKRPGVSASIDWTSPPGECPGPPERVVSLWLFVVAVGLGATIGLALLDPQPLKEAWPVYMSLAWVPSAAVAGVLTAGLVTREREADTLIMLLTVPPDRSELLWRKFQSVAVQAMILPTMTLFIGMLVFLLLPERLWFLAFLTQGLVVVSAAATVGLAMTVVCKTTFLSQAAAVMMALSMTVVPGWVYAVYEVSPAAAVVCHVVVLAVVAVVGWAVAAWRFEGYANR